jgi:hypothetical protein
MRVAAVALVFACASVAILPACVDENRAASLPQSDGTADGTINKLVPKPDADPSKLIGKRLLPTN